MAAETVGYLEVVQEGDNADETQYFIPIRGSGQFFLGRNATLCRHSWPDPFISNRHLRIHSILYEQDPISGIPPFVYATDFSTNGTYFKKSTVEGDSSQKRGIRMGRSDGAFLLDDGDELQLSDSLTLIFRSNVPLKEKQLTRIQERERRIFSSQYLLTDRVLGVGGFGKVLVAIHQQTKRQVACKVINLRQWWFTTPTSISRWPNSHRDQRHARHFPDSHGQRKRWPSRVMKCFREFDILKDLSHPNIVGVEKVFWSSNTIYIFQELVAGGDLFSYLEYKGGHLQDVEAAVIIRQVLKGTKYLHDQSIVHRDLKPDNIMMTSLDDGARVIITDFGNARYLPDERSTAEESSRMQRMFSYVGTLEYSAPEIHQCKIATSADQGYSKAVDMWSIGSITSTVLGGEIIFAAYQFRGASEKRYYQGVLELASQCDLSVLDDASNLVWTKVGDRPKDFIKKLLVLREDDRMTADEALAHDWFSNKFHAAEFEALYERTTRDWKPRPKASIFVEPILRDVTADSLPDSALSREPASHFFASPPGDSGDHTSFGNTSTSPTRQTNIPLSSIVEGDEPEYVYTRSCMDQEPTNPMHEGMYEADGDFGGRDDASANVEDAQYDFSIPAPPPLTPTAEEDSVIVLETPMRATKQFHEQPDDAEAAAASATAATYGHGSIKSFAQRLSKEKKHRYRPY